MTIVLAGSARGVRCLGVTRRWLRGLGLGASLGLALAALGGVWFCSVLGRSAQLEAENDALRARLVGLDDRLRGVGQTLDSMKALDARLRAMTAVSVPGAGLGIGPVGVPAAPEVEDDAASAQLRSVLEEGAASAHADRLEARLSEAEAEAARTRDAVTSLSVFLHGQLSRLASTPSRRPTSGPVSSGFGSRVDPFTGAANLHAGVDFSPDRGTEVIATGDAVVVFAGRNPTFGRLIELDHGHGLTTRYAHLDDLRVAEGARVRRGEVIGTVGNTGRSTGPHLHYEVRLRGVPQDPARFLLE